jgi:hypothetical protein
MPSAAAKAASQGVAAGAATLDAGNHVFKSIKMIRSLKLQQVVAAQGRTGVRLSP